MQTLCSTQPLTTAVFVFDNKADTNLAIIANFAACVAAFAGQQRVVEAHLWSVSPTAELIFYIFLLILHQAILLHGIRVVR